jgi:hypothetical protein
MDNTELVSTQWQYVLDMLPDDLEDSARAKLAMRRRREVYSAADLLRLALAYSVCDFSLRKAAAWAAVVGMAELSAPALGKRLANSSDWLGHLVFQWLRAHGLADGTAAAMPVRVVDATVISRPGSHGTDWRVHLGLDLAQERITSIDLTGPEGGETLLRHDVPAGQIILADRGYGHRPGIAHALDAGDHVVVRATWQNLPLQTLTGQPVDFGVCASILSEGEIGDWSLQFEQAGRVYSVRLIAMHKSAAAAEKEIQRLCKEARRKKRSPDPRSLAAAHFIYLVTDLPAERLEASEVLELYRLRWQIEIAFKRLKSLLNLDHLRAKRPQTAAAYLYGKLLGALLLDELYAWAESFFPWGFPLLDQASEQMGAL